MRINVKGTAEGALVEIVQPGDGGPETDSVVNSVTVTEGNELLVNVPKAEAIADVEYGNVVSASGEPETPDPAAPGDVGGGNEGSAQQGAEGTVPPAGGGEAPTGAEGEGGGAPDAGGQGDEQGDGGTAGQGEEGPTTSAASEKPLYLVDGDTIPEGFSESGLETPDGKTLFHFGADVAGGPTTGNADGVSVYAESADNEKPVQPATPAEGAAA